MAQTAHVSQYSGNRRHSGIGLHANSPTSKTINLSVRKLLTLMPMEVIDLIIYITIGAY
jgi:hypothetical protein